MYSQKTITYFKTKWKTFRNDNYMSNYIQLPRQHYLKTRPNEACNAFMHLEKSVFHHSPDEKGLIPLFRQPCTTPNHVKSGE